MSWYGFVGVFEGDREVIVGGGIFLSLGLGLFYRLF